MLHLNQILSAVLKSKFTLYSSIYTKLNSMVVHPNIKMEAAIMEPAQNEAMKFKDNVRGPAQNETMKLIIVNAIDQIRNLKKKRAGKEKIIKYAVTKYACSE